FVFRSRRLSWLGHHTLLAEPVVGCGWLWMTGHFPACSASACAVSVTVTAWSMPVGFSPIGATLSSWTLMVFLPQGGLCEEKRGGHAAAAGQVGHVPQKVTSAACTAKPWVSEGVRHGAWPTTHSTSWTAPHTVHTRWWWLSDTRSSKSIGLPAGSMRRTRPASAKSPSAL